MDTILKERVFSPFLITPSKSCILEIRGMPPCYWRKVLDSRLAVVMNSKRNTNQITLLEAVGTLIVFIYVQTDAFSKTFSLLVSVGCWKFLHSRLWMTSLNYNYILEEVCCTQWQIVLIKRNIVPWRKTKQGCSSDMSALNSVLKL